MQKKRAVIIGINLGLVMVVALLAWIFGPSLFMEAQYQKQVQQKKSGEPTIGFGALMYSMPQVARQAGLGFEGMINKAVEPAIIPISTEFGVIIPKIFA